MTLHSKVNEKGNMLIVFMYVVDLIITRYFSIKGFIKITERKFQMIDFGIMNFFLGIELQHSKCSIFISKTKYASAFLKIFNMSICKVSPAPVIIGLKLRKDDEESTVDPTLFKRLVGSLMYLTATRPDIMYGVSLISRFME